jgi:hypothetical protein
MIPEDAKARRQASVLDVKEQFQVVDHFVRIKPEDRPVPFSDGLFKNAAIRWLIETDQVGHIFYSSCDDNLTQ